MKNFVIIGGVAAGTKAAAKLRRLCPDSNINIYTDDTHVSYSTCGFPYFIGGNFDDEADLFARSVEEFEKSNIHIHLNSKCEDISVENKTICGKNFEAKYDKLLITTGAYPIIPNIKNNFLKNIFTLRKVEDALNIKTILKNSSHVTIIGGGYIGIELMEAFVNQGLKVTLVEVSSAIMPIFDKDISFMIQQHVLEHCNDCIEIINNDFVVEFCGNEYVNSVKTKNGREFKTDFVVECIGVKPNVELAIKAGIEIGMTGAIKVDEQMQTSAADIYAAGDCAEKFHIVARKNVWYPLASTAIKEGRCAAINMSGGKDFFYGVLGSAVTKYFDYSMALTGLNEENARIYGFDPVSVVITKYDKVSYMPDANEITLKLIADKNTRMILGAQSVVYGNDDKRVNIVVPALNCHITVDEFMKNDLPYSPAFSTSIDPILTACEKLLEKF
jgi:NADPH-dependent 2,4-dienoyl-CoA reductase/sulfur reductase-like enzyme